MGVSILEVIFFLLNVAGMFCGYTVHQDPFVSGLVGSTVNLNCHLICDEESFIRVNPYWKIKQSKVYIYPHGVSKYEPRVKEINEGHPTNYSVSLSDLKLSDTEFYVCYVSLLVRRGGKVRNIVSNGNGTVLFVHGPMEMESNNSEVTCKIQVPTIENVNLTCESGNPRLALTNKSYGHVINPDGSYWIISRFTVPLGKCVGHQPFSCLLQHTSGYIIAKESIKVPCTGTSKGLTSINKIQPTDAPKLRHPILLYSLLLGTSFFILLIVILIYWTRRQMVLATRRPKTNTFPDNNFRNAT